MSLKDRMLGFFTLGGRKSGSITNSLELLNEILNGGRESRSGKVVSPRTMLEVTTVLACVRVIAEGICQVPLRVMRETGKSKNPQYDHPLFNLLYRAPNDFQTSFEFREFMSIQALLLGNSYAYINRVRGGAVIGELLPLQTNAVTMVRNGWDYYFNVAFPDGTTQAVPKELIWHWKGPSWDSFVGMDASLLLKEAIGLAIAGEEMAAKNFSNGARPSGVLSTPSPLNDKQLADARNKWRETYEGTGNAFKTILLHGSWTWTATSGSAVDAQLMENRKFQIEEICRGFRVMPIMIGYSDKASTYASAEQMFLAHLVHTLMPWYARLEQSADVRLLSKEEMDKGYYTKFFGNALMRGSMAERVAFYKSMYEIGALNPNEIRALEDMNPYAGGEKYRVPSNMVDPNAEPAKLPEPTPAAGAGGAAGGANPPQNPQSGGLRVVS